MRTIQSSLVRNGTQDASGEETLLDRYRRGTFKLRRYRNPDYPFVVGIPKRFGGGKRARKFFASAWEAAAFIEEQYGAIKAGVITPESQGHSNYRPACERPRLPELPVATRIELLKRTVKMVANNATPAAIISGPGGLGKTHEVLKALGRSSVYKLFKGFSSARGLYETLHRHNGDLLVFDDCDAALTDRVAVEILKGALDTYSKRTLSWLVKGKNADPSIPSSFDFDGRLIFITNRCLPELDQALRTRCLIIDLHMTKEEILNRIDAIAGDLPDYMPVEKQKALTFIRANAEAIKNLSLRTLILVLKILRANGEHWEDLARYAVTQ